ncbi:MAG: ATP-binding protein, partial [Ilumatobacteraceae bacterium]
RRILLAILSIAVLAIALFAVPLAFLVERFVDDNTMLRVERQAILAARVVPEDFATRSDPVELPPNSVGIHLGLYDLHGELVSGTGPATADVATTGALANHVTDTETDAVRVVAVPVSADEAIIGVIRAEQSTTGSDARTQRIVLVLGSLAVGVVAVGAGIGYVIAGRLARPVRDLSDAAVRLGDGDFSLDVPRSNIPEIDQAAVAMTATAARLDDLVARERAFSADASHQLRTPLAGLRAAIETELEFPRPDHTEVLRESLDDIERLERTIAELLAIARTPQPDQASTALASIFDEITAAWHGRFALVGRRLTVADASGSPEVRGHPLMLRHALDVLLDNALTHGDGETRIELHQRADTVTITVSDEGPGFQPPAKPPADPNKVASGLGLPLAQRLVEALPGRLVMRRTTRHPQIDIVLQRVTAAST